MKVMNCQLNLAFVIKFNTSTPNSDYTNNAGPSFVFFRHIERVKNKIYKKERPAVKSLTFSALRQHGNTVML